MNSTIHPPEDDLVFLEEPENPEASVSSLASATWRIMIIDDDPDVHSATTFALGSLEIQHRALSFLHAYSAAEAREILSRETDIAVVLLDVVMEQEDAGLQLVNYIRNTLGLSDVRIILRTGQPGYAPEIDAIRDYDINDYKTKSELTRTKLYTTVTSAIRSYEQICAITSSRRGLEMIINASAEIIGLQGIKNFANGVLDQVTRLLGTDTDGFVCVRKQAIPMASAPDHLVLVAGSGRFSTKLGQTIDDVAYPPAEDLVQRSLAEQKTVFDPESTALYFRNETQKEFSLFLDCGLKLSDIDKRLLSVFCNNVSVALDNLFLNSRLHDYAFFDPLTGLANRLKLLQGINDVLKQRPQVVGQTLSLIDIDHFAETNDALGHQFGDYLLIAVSQRLRTHFGESSLLARVGSDTFAVLGDSKIVSPHQILKLFEQEFEVDHQEVQLSATIGLIELVDYEGDGSDALKDTNIALKRAKTNQRGSYEYFTRSMGVEIRDRVMMMHALRQAFEQEKLFLVYQPQINMVTGKALGAEALLRWRTDEGKFIPPDQFIPIAEYSGMIIEIGDWVLRTACKELVRLHNLGYTDFNMAVNVSQAQFSHPMFMQSLQQTLDLTGAPAKCVELEITESMAMKDPDQLVKTLEQIKAMGVRVSVDDFGTGFSSLSHLQRLSIDKLKIDRAFVRDIRNHADEGSIAKMIVQLGKHLGLQVIAEGVENVLQAESLISFDCHLAQGYLYSPPLPTDQFQKWLKDKNG